MKMAKIGHSLCKNSWYIYSVGGTPSTILDITNGFTDFEKYDPKADIWVKSVDLSHKRMFGASLIIGGKWLYALKGCTETNERIELFYCAKWESIDLPNLFEDDCWF